MTFDEAKTLLLLHSCGSEDIDHPTWRGGCLGSLRPYGGSLNEGNFHAVMAALVGVAPHLRGEARVDREVVSALWSLCALARLWALEPGGMLRRNGLISDADQARLAEWL